MDSGNVEMDIYLFMMEYDVTFDWLKLEKVYNKRDARRREYPLVCRCDRIVKTINNWSDEVHCQCAITLQFLLSDIRATPCLC